MTCTLCGSDRHTDTAHIDGGPDVVDRDPDDIKLHGGPRPADTWSTPMSYRGHDSECWACGNVPVQIIHLATSHYYLCKVCALEMETIILQRAASHLGGKAHKLREEIS